MKNKIIIVFFAATLMIATGAAAGENPTPEQTKPVSQAENVDFSDYRNVTFFQRITSNLLSVTTGSDTYQPGETATFDVTAEFIVEETGSFDKVVGFYKCHDSGCDDPELDKKIDGYSESEFFYAQVGDKVSWTVDWQVPQEEGYYAATAYVNDPGNQVLTETPNRKIIKVESTTDSDGDGVIDSNDDCPNTFGEGSDGCPLKPEIVSSGTDVTVTDSQVMAEVNLENRGNGDMTGSNIVEMQIRPEGSGLLSFVSDQRVCDEDYPENVHKRFELNSGESETVTLSTSTSNLEKGKSYDVFIVTANDCYPDNEPVEPYPGGEKVDNFFLDQPVVDIKQGSDQQVAYTTDRYVVGNISLVNTGDKDMSESHILEMQVRPKGSGLLSALSFTEPMDTCDSSHPENVHVDFKLKSGESQDYSLRVSKDVLESGKYDVWMITREGCGGGPVEPHGTGVIADTVTVEKNGGGSSGVPWKIVAAVVGLIAVFGGVYRRYG